MRAIVWLRRFDYRRRYNKRHPTAAMTSIPVVYYLHLGKTGGSFAKTVLRDADSFTDEGVLFVPFGHNITQRHLPAGSSYFFATRDPVSRFVSGFYSRKRKGQPTSFRDWSRGEARAFGRFAEANELAEALDDPDPEQRAEARAAMRAIKHVREFQHDWFPDRIRLAADLAAGRANRLRQEHLNSDMKALFASLGAPLAENALASRAPVHANIYTRAPQLSERAYANLRAHYAADYVFLSELDQLTAATPQQ